MLEQSDGFELELDVEVDDLARQVGVLVEHQSDVVGDRHRIEERAGLEEDPELLADLVEPPFVKVREVVSEQLDRPFVGLDRPDHEPEHGGLARARAAHDHHGFARVDVKVHAVENGAPARSADDASHRDDGLGLGRGVGGHGVSARRIGGAPGVSTSTSRIWPRGNRSIGGAPGAISTAMYAVERSNRTGPPE